MLVLAIGMPRAGSGWHYNLIQDVVVANGGVLATEIRNKNKFNQRVLTEVNCNIGIVNFKRMFPLMRFAKADDFVIKAHSVPTAYSDRLLKQGKVRALFIYRDPRAAALSAYNYGKRKRDAGKPNYFSKLSTVEEAIEFIAEYVEIWEAWMKRDGVLVQRYEDLLGDYVNESKKILSFLGIDGEKAAVKEALARYEPGKTSEETVQKLHYYKGEAERFRKEMTEDQLNMCEKMFGEEIVRMGYRI